MVNLTKIFVPLDNSRYSEWALEIAPQLASRLGSVVVGCHVYAGRLHDQRFRDMEPGLPERYQDPAVLARERDLHDSLITRGLKLIADSYLKPLEQRCAAMGLTYVRRVVEGKNYAELVREIEKDGFDLVIMGARGLGAALRDGEAVASLGSVCERVVRRTCRDVLVLKDGRPLAGTIVVGIDGSPRSFAALRIALKLAEIEGGRVQAVGAFDPVYHKAAFASLKGALTEEAEKVFKVEQQEKLHDELIDDGLAKIYARHLETASRIAVEAGHQIETFLLPGKPYVVILSHLEKVQANALVLGRTGVHADEGMDIGSNAENLLRQASCHVLLVGRTFAETAAQTQGASEAVALYWTPGALALLNRVPPFARGMAQKAIAEFAKERGCEAVDEQVVKEAREKFGC